MISEIDKYFAIKSVLPNTMGIVEASEEHIKELMIKKAEILEKLTLKHNTKDPVEALDLEETELAKQWSPSQEALDFLKQLNEKYKGKTIKFYYTHPMLYYFSIDDPDCDQVPIYEVLCQSIELVDEKTRKIPMIITKEKNYTLLNVVDIEIIENETPTIKEVLQKAASLDSESYELTDIAEKVIELLDDKEWAREIYKRSLDICTESGDACIVAISIANTLKDKKFVSEALLKAYELKKTNYDFCELLEACKYSELSNETISKWIEEYAKVCKTSNDFLSLSKISEKHRDFALKKALENTTDVYECFEIIDDIKKK